MRNGLNFSKTVAVLAAIGGGLLWHSAGRTTADKGRQVALEQLSSYQPSAPSLCFRGVDKLSSNLIQNPVAVMGLQGRVVEEFNETERKLLFIFKDVRNDGSLGNETYCSATMALNPEGLLKGAKEEGRVALQSIFPTVRFQIKVWASESEGVVYSMVPYSAQRVY
jgi:hypothetical protein